MSDLVSVIIPVYNVEKYLKQCVDSVLSQTYHNIEIILIDDGSSDNSGAICDDYAKADSRIKVIHKENAGVSTARNIGIKVATGQFITFIDSDDWIDSTYVEKLYNGLVEHNVDVCFCKMNYTNGEKFVKSTEYALKNVDDYKMNFKEFQKHLFMLSAKNEDRIMGSSCRILYKKSLFDNFSLHFNTKIVYCEDMCFLFSCLQVIDKYYVVDEYLYFYRQHNESFVHKYHENYLFVQTNFYDNIIGYINDETLKKQIAYQVIHALLTNELRVAKKYQRNKIKQIYKLEQYKNYNYSLLKKSINGKGKRDLLLLLLVKCRIPSVIWLIFHIQDKFI